MNFNSEICLIPIVATERRKFETQIPGDKIQTIYNLKSIQKWNLLRKPGFHLKYHQSETTSRYKRIETNLSFWSLKNDYKYTWNEKDIVRSTCVHGQDAGPIK